MSKGKESWWGKKEAINRDFWAIVGGFILVCIIASFGFSSLNQQLVECQEDYVWMENKFVGCTEKYNSLIESPYQQPVRECVEWDVWNQYLTMSVCLENATEKPSQCIEKVKASHYCTCFSDESCAGAVE